MSILLLLAIATSFFTGCAPKPLERFTYDEPKMGAPMRIVLYAPEKEVADAAAQAAFTRVDELNAILSDYDADSELSRLGRVSDDGAPTAPILVSDDLWAVLQASNAMSLRTEGAFDITVGPYVRLWRRARRLGELPRDHRIADASESVGYQKLELEPDRKAVRLLARGMRLDVGGIAKGYVAYEALKTLRAQGITSAMIDAGGDVTAGDPPPDRSGWRIRLSMLDRPESESTSTQNANQNQEAIHDDRHVLLANMTAATSGDAHRFVEVDGVRYSHILDPRTGVALHQPIAVTVLAADAMQADAMASAVSVMGPAAGLKLVNDTPGVEAIVLTIDDGLPTLHHSAGYMTYDIKPPGPTK